MEPTPIEPPQNPAGEFQPETNLTDDRRAELIREIEQAPRRLEQAVAGLFDDQFDAKYRNWTIRQIVHHLADSHVHSYIRFKWALTEETPLIKAYDENLWAELPDALRGDDIASLTLYAGIHQAWSQLLRLMTAKQFARSFKHPETGKTVSLDDALCYYAWHARHHTAQIVWIRDQRRW